MKKILLTAVFILLSVSSCTKQEKANLAITNVTIIDVKGGPVKSEMTVLIKNNRISKIDRTDKISLAEGVTQIDGSGKFLIPGLWDMHVHWYDENYLPIFIANGVLGIRQMWGTPEHLQWRKEMAEGKLLCPRLEIGSPIIDGPNPMWPGSIAISNAEEAQSAVRRFKDEGYDFIKVLHLLPREAFFAIAEECESLEIPFAGHFPFTVSAAEAVESGMKSNEHFWNILMFCSTQEEAFRKELTKLIADNESWISIFPIWIHQHEQYLETFDQKKAANLFRLFAQHSCWQCPTLTLRRSLAYRLNDEFRNDPRLKYMSSDIKNSWNPHPTFTPEVATILE